MKSHAVLLLSLGCTGTLTSGDAPGGVIAGDDVAPILAVASPARAAFVDGTAVVVEGTASDDRRLRAVKVNGTPVQVGSDGRFSAMVTVPAGVTVVETIAEDAGGNSTRDVRAILAGSFAPVTDAVPDGVTVRLGPIAFKIVDLVVGRALSMLDLGALAQRSNPLVDVGDSCFGVEVELNQIEKTGIQVRLVPEAGAVGAAVDVTGLQVHLRARYHVFCASDSQNVHLTADALHVRGRLGLAVSGDRLAADLSAIDVSFDHFGVDAGGIPGEIRDLFEGDIEREARDAVKDAIADAGPGAIEDLLREMSGFQTGTTILDRQVTVNGRPTALAIDAGGATATLELRVTVPGAEGTLRPHDPGGSAAPLVDGTEGLAAAVADDALNQLLVGLWGSGALVVSVPLSADHPARLLFGAEADRIDVTPLLPPVVSAQTGAIRLDAGEVHVSAIDADAGDAVVAELAVSASLPFDLALGADGHLALTPLDAVVTGQVITQSDELPLTLGETELDLVGQLMAGEAGDRLAEAVAGIDLPLVGTTSVVSSANRSAGGYLVLDATLAAP